MATAATVDALEGEEGSVQVNVEEARENEEEGEADRSEGWTVPKFSHPVYKKLSSLNGELNALSLSKLKENLTSMNLSSMYVGLISITLLNNIFLGVQSLYRRCPNLQGMETRLSR